MLAKRQPWHNTICSVTIGILACACDISQADPILSFSPSIDPSQAILGRTFSVDVVLSGLNLGDKLTFLGLDATVEAAKFSLPSNLRAGGIVRDGRSFSGNSFNFGGDNFSTASFESRIGPMPPFPLPPIESNGIFMSFDITPTQVGTSALNFVFVGSEGRNITDLQLPTARGGGSIQFSVAAVPEPNLTGVWLGIAVLHFFRRKHKPTASRTVDTTR